MRFLLWIAALLVLVGLARAQDEPVGPPETVVLEVRTTSTSGLSVFLDRGRDDGLEPGDTVRLFVPGAPVLVGEVRSVSSTSARVELFEEAQVEVGTPGEVRVPRVRLEVLRETTPPRPDGEPLPEQPPWTRPPEEWSTDLPLLAPLEDIEPEDRETRVVGRVFAQADATWDHESGGTDTFYGRFGTDLRIENPFERGGLLELDLELAQRMAESESEGFDEEEAELRFQRLSYGRGGTRHDPTRWRMGRFLQEGFPEFGLLDGVELSQYADPSTYVGLAAGLLPEPTFELSTGDDWQVAAYAVRELGARRELAWRVGVQKTWHGGTPDRDLVAAATHWRPHDAFDLRGSVLVDYYTSGEAVKSAGFELTELHLFSSWRPLEGAGLSASYDQVRWPDIRREEFVPLPADELDLQETRRGSLRLWAHAHEDVRLSLRGDWWRNESEDGSGGELRLDWRDLLWEHGRLSLGLFSQGGQFSAVEGLRLRVDRTAGSGHWSLGYELSRSEQEAFEGEQGELLRQSLRGSWDTRIGDDWSLSLFGEGIFGEAQEALSLGIFLQRSF